MKRIALTQRVEEVAEYGEQRDCLDQRWTQLLLSVGMVPVPLPNCIDDVAGYLDACDIDGLILTGGGDIGHGESVGDSERDKFEKLALKYFESRAKPVLGVCRGMQFIALYYGGSIHKVVGHTAVQHKVDFSEWWKERFTTTKEINSYHNWGISLDGIVDDLLYPEAWAFDGSIEAFRHRGLPVYGVMWHPERQGFFSDFEKGLIEYIFQ